MKKLLKAVLTRTVSAMVFAQANLTAVLGGLVFRLRQRSQAVGLMETAQRILVVRLDEIGDVVLFTPFLRVLRQRFPRAQITLVVKPQVFDLVEHCPDVDRIFPFSQGGGKIKRFLVMPWRAFAFAARHLWKEHYDLALLPRREADSAYAAFIAFWSGAACRIGYSETVTTHRQQVNRGFDRLLTHAVTDPGLCHDSAANLAILGVTGEEALEAALPEVWLTPEDHAVADALLQAEGIRREDVLIGLCPSGGHSPLKQWPVEHFAEAGRRLQEEYGAHLIIFGGPGEEELGARLERDLAPISSLQVINLVGKTTLRQMAAVMQRCRAYVGNDVGPTHVAAAAGVPVTAIFGSSCPHRFRPLRNSALVWRDLPCGPCHISGHSLHRCERCIYPEPRCLTDIPPEEVLHAIRSHLRSTQADCLKTGHAANLCASAHSETPEAAGA